MKNKTIIGIIFALFIITTACQKKEDVRPVTQQENQDIKKSVPVDQVKKVVGYWREDFTETPYEHFNRFSIQLPNSYGDGIIGYSEGKKNSNGGYDWIHHTDGNYFTYEIDRESIPNLKDLEAKYGEAVCGLSMSFDDATYFNYIAFVHYYPQEDRTPPTMYWIEAPIDGSQPANPRVIQGDH